MPQFTARVDTESADNLTDIRAEYNNKFVQSLISSAKVGANLDTIGWIVAQPRRATPTKNGGLITWTMHQETDPETGADFWVIDSIDDPQPLPIFSENFPTNPDIAEAWIETNVTNLATAKTAMIAIARQLAIITSELQR